MPAKQDHITCLDTFSINPDVQTEGAFDACLGRVAPGVGSGEETTVSLLPGLEVVDLYGSSLRAEVWKDGSTSECLVPRAVVGWEFFSLLWPQPEGAFPIKIGGAVELLLGRSPAAEVMSSALFAYVPRGQSYSSQDKPRTRAGSAAAPRVRFEEDVEGGSQASTRSASSDRESGRPHRERRSALQCELLARNLDASKRSLVPRITLLYPWATFRDMKMLPEEEESWSLWIAPRNRTLMLLNRHLGRIDLHLAVLFTVDSIFRGGGELSGTFARLFEPLGTSAAAGALFHPFNPLKIHCGFTNAVVAEHVLSTIDGRGDYAEILGGDGPAVGLPTFLVSNASSNLCFLTPLEAHVRRGGAPAGLTGPSGPLPEAPVWTMRGPVTEADLHELTPTACVCRPSASQAPPRA